MGKCSPCTEDVELDAGMGDFLNRFILIDNPMCLHVEEVSDTHDSAVISEHQILKENEVQNDLKMGHYHWTLLFLPPSPEEYLSPLALGRTHFVRAQLLERWEVMIG